jgi:hypothetical protein
LILGLKDLPGNLIALGASRRQKEFLPPQALQKLGRCFVFGNWDFLADQSR